MKLKVRSEAELYDSGVPWFPRKPLNWSSLRTKWLFKYKKELNEIGEDAQILSLTLRGVVENDPENPEGLVPKDYNTYQIFKKGDLVFKLIDLENLKTSRVGLVHKDGIMSPAYIRLVPKVPMVVDYFYLQFYSLYLQGVYNNLGSGVRSTLGPTDLGNLPVLIPSLDEQQRIVSFIQQQDRRIRKFIRNKNRLKDVIRERNEFDTLKLLFGGSLEHPLLRPSGISWCPPIPLNWETLRCRYLFREIDERSIDGHEVHLSMSQKFGLVPNSTIEERRLISESYAGGKLVKKGDLVLNRLKAHLGVFAIAREDGVISPDYSVFRAKRDISVRYFEAVLRTTSCRVELRRLIKGIVQGFWRLYSDDFFNISLPVPSLEEQGSIVEALDSRVAEEQKVFERIDSEIKLIQEHRARLIADAVTGRIDLRSFKSAVERESPNTDTAPFIEDSDELNEDCSEDEQILAEAINAD